MAKKTLKIKDIKVQSFVTKDQVKIKGGGSSYGCGGTWGTCGCYN